MKKILSLGLAATMAMAALPTAFAADQDHSLGTAVTIEGKGGEYTVTVPATLEPGQTGTVTAKGYWASGETLVVTAPSTVEVTNGIQKTNVNVSFAGIESLGSDLEEMNVPVSISIDDGGIKFGEWTGIIEYNVDLISPMEFKLSSLTLNANKGMTWAAWINSDYNINGWKMNEDNTIGNNGITIQLDGVNVLSTDTIVANASYQWSN